MHDGSQIKRALELDGASGIFELDESGYTRFVPSDKELEAINKWIATELDIAEDEYRPIYQDTADNIETYKAAKTQDLIDGEQAILPAPLARIAVDQYVATIFNMIVRPTPIVSLQPYFKDDYDVVVPPPPDMMAMMGPQMMDMGLMPGMIGATIKKSAEETAGYLETGYDYKLRECLGFVDFIREALTDMAVTGCAYAKICREKTERPLIEPKKKGAIIDLRDKEEKYVADGEQIRWYGLPRFNILKRIHENDLDEAEWVSERTPCSTDEFFGRCLSGDYPLLDEEEYEKLSRVVGEVKTDDQKRIEASTQNKLSPVPQNSVDVRLVWFYRRLKFKDEETGRTVIRKVSLMGDYHHGARKMCNIFRNPYDHQLRPYAVGYQLKDPHSDSGSSTTSISRWFQKVATHLIQSEIKNIFLANNWTPWYDEDGPAADQFAGTLKLTPGKPIRGKYDQDWGIAKISEAHGSMVPMLNVVRAMAREAQNMSALESGDSAGLGRTPSGSIAQILGQGSQQSLMFLRAVNSFVSRLMVLDMETRRQYEPLGEVIPTRDPETKAAINVPFRFPVGQAAKNFRISLTAADEAMAKEHETENLMLLLNIWQQLSQFVAQIAGPMQQATPAQQQLFLRIIEGAQAIFDRIVAITRTDKDKFNLKKEVDAVVAEAQQIMAEMEAMGANQAANAGAVQPGPAGEAYGGGPVGMAGEPADGGGAVASPQASVQNAGFVQ